MEVIPKSVERRLLSNEHVRALIWKKERDAFAEAADMVNDALHEWLNNDVETVPAFALPVIAKLEARAKEEQQEQPCPVCDYAPCLCRAKTYNTVTNER